MNRELTYRWSAYFEDGHILDQPDDDRYSKHDESLSCNPSSFRDIQEYTKSKLRWFHLIHSQFNCIYAVNLIDGYFYANNIEFSIEETELTDRKLIYYREIYHDSSPDGSVNSEYIVRYILGYEGKDANNETQKKVIYINA